MQSSRNWTPVKIIFTMTTPIVLAHPWLHLDGILAHLINRELSGSDYYVLPSKQPIEPSSPIRRMPLKNFKDFFHASISFFEPNQASTTTIYKRFYEQEAHTIETKKAKIDLGRGPFRSYMMRLPYIPARTVTFHALGDPREIGRLLSHLAGLGKKVVLGFGAIKSFRIEEEEEEDHSLIMDGKAMRPIPMRYCKRASEQMMLAYRPPYWDKRLVAACASPGAEVELRGS